MFRSSLAYQNNRGDVVASLQQRNLGISTSSTTSRSTCKTGSSSNYLRSGDVSTSTASQSSYNSRHHQHPTTASKAPYNPYGDDCVKLGSSKLARRPSESGDSLHSDGHRSLDLASSHTSDDDETVTTRSLSLNRNLKGTLIVLIIFGIASSNSNGSCRTS